MHLGIVRLQLEGLLIAPHRFGQVSLGAESVSQVVVSVEIVGIDLDGSPVARDRGFEISLILEGIAEIAVGLGVVGLDADGDSQAGRCFRWAFPRD